MLWLASLGLGFAFLSWCFAWWYLVCVLRGFLGTLVSCGVGII